MGGKQNFRHSLLRIADDDDIVDELIAAATDGKTDAPESISLATLFNALAGVSCTALLWELRCRLVDRGLIPLHVHIRDAMKFINGHQARNSGGNAVRRMATCELKPEESIPNCETNESGHLKHISTVPGGTLNFDEWMEFVAALGLTSFEGQSLFRMMCRRDDAI